MTTGDPMYYCQKCNTFHMVGYVCDNAGQYVVTFASTYNYDAQIVDLLQKILAKLEEIRMELP